MMNRRYCAMISIFFFICLLIPATNANDWLPINPQELEQKSPLIQKDVDAEVIFWDVRVDGLKESNYVRLKIFTEKGKEKWSTVIIPYFTEVRLIEGRTIKPDGTIVELKKDAIFDRTIVSANNMKLKAKSFAMPAVEPGSIVEYRWTEDGVNAKYYLQKEIPIQTASYHFKFNSLLIGVNFTSFNCDPIQLVKEKNGFMGFQLHNMVASEDEPHMPPKDSVHPYVLLSASMISPTPPAKYWNDLGKRWYSPGNEIFKVKRKIEEATSKVIGSESNPEAKIAKIFEFVRSQVKNVQDDALTMTQKEREKILKKAGAEEALERGMGSASDIQFLFGAMTTAAGFDTRFAFIADRSDSFFDPSHTNDDDLNRRAVVIRIGDNWKLFEPSSSYLPMGMLPWPAEGTTALIPDPQNPLFISTPLSPPEKSQKKRSAKLRLSEDGVLEGDVILEYTGHVGANKKETEDASSPAEREETLKNMFKELLSTAELSKIEIENITSRDKPFTYKFHIKIPGYAQRTGRRLFIQPAFFQKGVSPLFTTDIRKHDIYFQYPWSESDEIDINLPEGYDLENPEGQQPISIGAFGHHEMNTYISKDHRLLRCTRKFFIGGESRILYSAKYYPILKRFFDTVHQADNQTITLKQTGSMK
jgi:hypothetical protein